MSEAPPVYLSNILLADYPREQLREAVEQSGAPAAAIDEIVDAACVAAGAARVTLLNVLDGASKQQITISAFGIAMSLLRHDLDEFEAGLRVAAMKAYIDQNLAEPELGIDMLLEKFGASRATVYRDFAEDGGLQNFILSRRLHRAYRALSEAAPTRGAILAIAESCGFQTLAHFSRSFREHYGERPSDVLGKWQAATQDAERSQPVDLSAQVGGPVAALQWSYRRFN